MSRISALNMDMPTTDAKSKLCYLEHLDRRELGIALSMICGEYLGRGVSRTVFALNYAQDLVIKIEEERGEFQNVLEWKIWNKARETSPEVAATLAPCVDISTCGRVLIMKKTSPLVGKEVMLPAWLSDYGSRNMGMIDDRIVCHDYGLVLPSGSFSRLVKRKVY